MRIFQALQFALLPRDKDNGQRGSNGKKTEEYEYKSQGCFFHIKMTLQRLVKIGVANIQQIFRQNKGKCFS